MTRLRILPVVLGGILSITSCEPPVREPVRVDPPEVVLPDSYPLLSPEEAEHLIASSPGLTLIDVRSDGEAQKEGSIAHSHRYDYLHGEETFDELAKMNPTNPYLIYCAIGGRAKLTAQRLAKMGFTRVSILEGGINAWIAAGKPIEK
jgi:rhodanese-related sulfurtransferase